MRQNYVAGDRLPLVLGLAGSPREGSNSGALLEKALEGAESAGARTELVRISDLHIEPCRACGGCNSGKGCVQDDDMGKLAEKLKACNHVILATPVHFLGPPATVKAVIDRCQQFWEDRYRLGRPPVHDSSGSRALLIATAAANVFKPLELIVRAFFAVLGFGIVDPFLAKGLEEPGAVANHPEYFDSAREAGRRLVGGA